MEKAFSVIGRINMLHLLLINLFLIVFGGCQMQETKAVQTDDAQKIVLEHAKKNYSLSAADVKISDVTPKSFFPEVKQFYLEENKAQHSTYNYLVYKSQAYSSGTDGDLSRFLKNYDFVKKTDDAEKYLTLLRIFSLPKDINVIDDEFIKNHQKELQNNTQVQPPKLTKNADGSAELIFYATPVVPFKPEKWTAKFGTNSEIQISK
jgi:uncharacterized protein YcfL